MPALYLFNRRTLLAGDDLQLPSLAWGALSAVQTFVLLPILLWFNIELLLLRNSYRNVSENTVFGLDRYHFTQNTIHEDRPTITERVLQYADDDVIANDLSMQSTQCSFATSNFTIMTFPYLLVTYLFATSIFCAISLWYEQRIYQLSSLGTPTLNIHLRDPLHKLIEVKITYLAGYNLLLLCLASILSIQFIGEYIHCFPTIWWIVWFILLTSQGLQCLFTLTTLVSLLRVQPRRESSDMYQQHTDILHNHNNNAEMAEELWRNRCEGCCRLLAVSTCFLFGGQGIVKEGGEHFYGDIARALADYFAGFDEGEMDVVPSDIALGFAVLRHMQAKRELAAKREALGLESRTGSAVNWIQQKNNAALSSMNRRTLFFRWKNNGNKAQNGLEDEMANAMSQQESTPSVTHGPNSPSRANEDYQSFTRVVLSPLNPDDLSEIQEGAYFARHQLAIYTWMLYYYMYPITGTFRLIGRTLKEKIKCKSGVSYDSRESIVGDNFFRIHEATMLAHARMEKSDIAYASFEAGFYETPYCIVIDRKWKTIVLSIRGSLTLEDCVVDVLLDPSPLDALGEQYGFPGNGQYCHGGVFECTQWLYQDLIRHKVLDTLLLEEHSEYRDFTLRVVGHSLGAGIGVILSLMLRNKFSNIRCLCYSPPGGLLTWELATSCSDFVTSFVLDSDIVPRLSLNNMESLRDEVLNLIARVKLSKYDIAKRIFWHGLCGEVELGDLDFLIQQNDDILYPSDNVPDSEFLQQLRRFESIQQNRRSTRGISREVLLYPPGNIIHLVKTGQSKTCVHNLTACLSCGASNSGAEYTPIRKENDDFNEIEISPTLWTDHFPNRVCVELERIASQFGSDTAFYSPTAIV